MKKKIIIDYQEFNTPEELEKEDADLLGKAVAACKNSYSPFSKFRVGAALRLADGKIFTASNQESVAFPSGMCAERALLYYVLAKHPKTPITSIAIAAQKGGKLTTSPTRPCGACIQVMLDAQKRGGRPIKIILGGAEKIEVIPSVNNLAPFSFDNL